MPTVPVNIPGANYQIIIKLGLLRDIGNPIGTVTQSRKVGIVTDSMVGPLYVNVVVERVAGVCVHRGERACADR